MKSKIFLREIQRAINVSSRQLCKALGIQQPSFYRYINGVNEMDFSLASEILEVVKIKIDINKLVPSNKHLLNLIHELNAKHNSNKFNNVSIAMRNLLEFNIQKFNMEVVPNAKLIRDHKWRIFYQILINWILKKPIDQSLILNNKWSPLPKLYKFQEKIMDPYFRAHNVLLPKGELEWV